jgi:hypothetical protein
MTTSLTDLDRLEREAFRRFYDDGLVDVYIGIMLVAMGVASVTFDRTDSTAFPMLVLLAAGFGITVPLLLVRRQLLRSRLGSFQPGPTRRSRIKRTRLALLVSLVVGVVVLGAVAAAVIDKNTDLLGIAVPLVWAVLGVAVFGCWAHFLDVPRFYFHALVWSTAMPLLIWPDVLWDYRISPWLALGLPGGIIAAVGIFKLVTFLRKYPVTTDELLRG